MTPQINTVLDTIRRKMEGMEAFGPEIPGVMPGSNNASLPGDGGADNITDIEDTFDMFLSDIIDLLMFDSDIGEDEAADFIFYMADSMADEGMLPPMPDDGADEEELAAWMGKAKSIGFSNRVLKAARDAG